MILIDLATEHSLNDFSFDIEGGLIPPTRRRPVLEGERACRRHIHQLPFYDVRTTGISAVDEVADREKTDGLEPVRTPQWGTPRTSRSY